MPTPASPPGVFDAADVVGRIPARQLKSFVRLISPYVAAAERAFHARIRGRFDAKQAKALLAVTTGSAVSILNDGDPPGAFFELVEYSGRRLAKLNVSPQQILDSMHEYSEALDAAIQERDAAAIGALSWIRERLQLGVFIALNKAFSEVREAESQAFYDLFRAELEAYSLDDLLTQFLANLTRICQAQYGRLILIAADGSVQSKAEANSGVARATASPAVVGSFEPMRLTRSVLKQLQRTRYLRRGETAERLIVDQRLPGVCQSYWSVPVFYQDTFAGVVQLGFVTERPWLPRELQLVDTAVEQCLEAAEKARLVQDLAAREEQVRQLGEHMWQVEEEERRRISRELHDEAGQSMLFIRLQLELLIGGLPAAERALKGRLTELHDVTQKTILEIRRIISALSPAVLDQLGLGPALRQVTKRLQAVYPVRVRLALPPRLGRLPKQAEIITYRLVQECCNNIAKHSAAKTVNIHLSSTDSTLALAVEDDGIGFDVEAAMRKQGSFGLTGMMERVVLLGGEFAIETAPKQGTRIHVTIPLFAKNPHPGEAAIRTRRQER